MGVRDLQSFIENQCPLAFCLIDIAQMVEDYRRIHPNVDEPVIVVDGSNCAVYWIHDKEWFLGGQWHTYLEALIDFVDAFKNIGVKLIFFFDGIKQANKRETCLGRDLQAAEFKKEFFEALNASRPLPRKYYIIPGIEAVIRHALKHVCMATVYYNVDGECDSTIAAFAAKNQCMAILAQDTDYVIYQTVPYISIRHLDMETMQTMWYCRSGLCATLGLQKEWMLPLLACLVGTDVIPRRCLQDFHNWIGKRYCRGLGKFTIHMIIKGVAQYIASLHIKNQTSFKSQIPNVHEMLFQDEVSLEDFQKAVEEYSQVSAKSTALLYSQAHGSEAENEGNAYEVLVRKTINIELTPIVFKIISVGALELEIFMEDVYDQDILPTNVVVYRPIRQRMYGLIFQFKDNFLDKYAELPHLGRVLPKENYVEEWFIHPETSEENSETVSPIFVDLPDGLSNATLLHAILMENDEGLLNKKWAAFEACLGLTISCESFQQIPEEFKSLCVILNYLIREIPIKLWEVEAFLVQAVRPEARLGIWNEGIQLEPYNSRAVHLASLFLSGALVLFDLISFCGNPYHIRYGMPWNFFNGKWFHHCYKEAERGVEMLTLCSDNKKVLEGFQKLKHSTLEGIDMNQCFTTEEEPTD